MQTKHNLRIFVGNKCEIKKTSNTKPEYDNVYNQSSIGHMPALVHAPRDQACLINCSVPSFIVPPQSRPHTGFDFLSVDPPPSVVAFEVENLAVRCHLTGCCFGFVESKYVEFGFGVQEVITSKKKSRNR